MTSHMYIVLTYAASTTVIHSPPGSPSTTALDDPSLSPCTVKQQPVFSPRIVCISPSMDAVSWHGSQSAGQSCLPVTY